MGLTITKMGFNYHKNGVGHHKNGVTITKMGLTITILYKCDFFYYYAFLNQEKKCDYAYSDKKNKSKHGGSAQPLT